MATCKSATEVRIPTHADPFASSDKRPPSTFLDLPAELRNWIYGYTLIYGILQIPSCSLWGRLPLLDVGLLRTCCQIHTETVLLLYRFNNFRLKHNMNLDMLMTCLNEEKRSDVRRLDMDMNAAKKIERQIRNGYDCPKLRLFPALEMMHVWGEAPEYMRVFINTSLALATGKKSLRIVSVAAQYEAWNKSSG
jgi:hypothetical protein